MNEPTPKRYQWSWRGIFFDFYRLCEILNLKSEPQKHAIKKLIRDGQSVKTLEEDIDEAIAALERWKEMVRSYQSDDGECKTLLMEITEINGDTATIFERSIDTTGKVYEFETTHQLSFFNGNNFRKISD